MISMITCVYNRADLLERTLYFMQKQTHKYEWEIIIIDDGSKDDIKSVFYEYKNKLPIRMFKTKRDWYSNAAYAANCGVKLAKGEYILYASPEVIHHGNTFDSMHEILESGDYLVAATVYDLEKKDNDKINKRKDFDLYAKFSKRMQLIGPDRDRERPLYFLGGWRKQTYLEVGGMEERFAFPGFEDNEFITRMKMYGVKPYYAFDDSKMCGFHQWHYRWYLKEKAEIQKQYRASRKLCVAIEKELITGGFRPANQNVKWGELPPGREVL